MIACLLTSLFVTLVTTKATDPITASLEHIPSAVTSGLDDSRKVWVTSAPSLVTCAFLCKMNVSCKVFSFSGSACSMYWSLADPATLSPRPAPQTAFTFNKKVCPQTLGNGTYTCLYGAVSDVCFCFTTFWSVARASCNSLATKLVSVETPSKNTEIISFIKLLGLTKCVWTSGVMISANPDRFIWNSTGTPANTSINYSWWLSGGIYLGYSPSTPEAPWRWDDYKTEAANCTALCEVQPL